MYTDKTKVLHVVYEMCHGGIETFLMSMLNTYDRDRFQMDIVYSGPNEGAYAPEVRRLGSKLLACRLGYDQIRFVWHFYKLLKQNRYDAVNVHLADMGAGAIVAAWLAGVPNRVASYHTGWRDRGFLRNFYMGVMRCFNKCLATAITTSSPAVTDDHFGHNCMAKDNIEAITYGCDTVTFANIPDNVMNFVTKPDEVIVGHVGSYRPQKNHEGLLKIMHGLVDQIPNVRFVLCGAACASQSIDGRFKSHIDSEIIRLGLKPYTTQVHGIADMRQFYHAIDIFVLPSRNEGMPISVIEAQAAGKPLVASNIDGIAIATAPEMKQNLFSVDDINGFTTCLVDLIKNKQKRLLQGKSGQAFAQQHLDIRTAVRRYERLYASKGTQ